MGQVEGSDDVEVCRGARVVVVTAGAKQQPGQSRMELAESTLRLTRSIMPRLVEVAPDATYVMVTNPVDVVTTAALKVTGCRRTSSSARGRCWTPRGCGTPSRRASA
jgi:L-lactate dehydrogenase